MTVFTPQPAYGPPRTDDKANFPDAADDWNGWIGTWAPELEAFAANLVQGFAGTSTSSVLIGSGSKSLTIQTGLAFKPGQPIVVARTSAPTNSMLGTVTSYNDTTGALVVNVTSVSGAGTYTDWSVSIVAASVTSAFVAGLLSAASAAAFRTAIGSGAVGDTIFQAATIDAAQNAMQVASQILETGTFSASGGPSFNLRDEDGWLAWELDIVGLIPSSAASVDLQFSFDNQATWRGAGGVGLTDYEWQMLAAATSAPTTSQATGAASTTGIRLATSVDTTANRNNRVKIAIAGPKAAGFGVDVEVSSRFRAGGAMVTYSGGGQVAPQAGPPTHCRIVPPGGITISGKYVLRGLRGF